MPARAIASGNISFGLVSIPVKLYSTTDNSSGIRFNTLHRKDGVRLKQQYICPQDNEVVPREEMIKGYEFAKGQYVTFTDEEIKALSEKASPAIEITEFVPISEVDPIYFEKAYFLGPEKGGERAYRLLAESMRQTGRCGLAKYASRGKMYLVLLRPFESGLIMQQLRYTDELRAFSEVPLDDGAELKQNELKLAVQLIEQIASDSFRPDEYEDEVRQRIMDAVQQKIEGEEVTETPVEEPKAQIIDLMEALKASLGEESEKKAAGTRSADRKPPRRSPRGASEKKGTSVKRARASSKS